MPSIVFTTSILPLRTANSARSPPSGTANSPGPRWRSADVRASRSSSAAGSPANSGTAATSSIVNMMCACDRARAAAAAVNLLEDHARAIARTSVALPAGRHHRAGDTRRWRRCQAKERIIPSFRAGKDLELQRSLRAERRRHAGNERNEGTARTVAAPLPVPACTLNCFPVAAGSWSKLRRDPAKVEFSGRTSRSGPTTIS